MTFGRLDVYWPDGPIDSYQLHKTSIAIGRSPGNDVVLDATAISRYHASLTFKDSQAILTDLGSVNGTYIDGRRVDMNASLPLEGGEEIQVGEIRLIFHPGGATGETVFEEDATRRIEYEQPTYKVELIAPLQPVTPGVYVQAQIVIHNLSNQQDHYFIEADGVPRDWVRLERVEALLEPGEKTTLMLSFKPLRKPDSKPGAYPFTVQVRSKSRPKQTVDATMTLHVLPYSGFGMDLGRKRVSGKQFLHVHLHNQGNAPLQISMDGHEPRNALNFSFKPRDIMLSAGERMTVRSQISPRRFRLLGGPRTFEVSVIARANDPSGFQAALPAQYVAVNTLSPSRAVGIIGALVIVTVVILAALTAIIRPTPPRIMQVALSVSDVVVSQPFTMTWQAQDVADLYVSIDGVHQNAKIGPEDSSVTLAIDTPGQHQVALVALNDGQIVQEAASIVVHPELRVVTFEANPKRLVRYISQDVLLMWDVQGGTRVRLTGMEALTGDAENTEYNPTDSRLLNLNVRDDVMIHLLAEGGAEQITERTLTLGVEDPQCTVTEEGAAIRQGPSELHAILTSAKAGQVVVPDRRDGSGNWLRLFASDDRRVWIAASALNCTNVEPRMFTVDAAPPTPVPTDTPTPTATPTSTPTPSITPSPTVTLTPTALPSATPPPTSAPLLMAE